MGMMVKIADESNGRIYKDGRIEKELTSQDINLLKKVMINPLNC